MFVIGQAAIEDDVATENFACDLPRCKGACCTIPGGRGAPLQDHEKTAVESALPAARKYLSEEHLRSIEQGGVVEGDPGNYSTQCIDGRQCVFVFFEEGVARCSIEKAYIAGETPFRKPLSCHLFPIRVSRISGSADLLRYERLAECRPGIARGNAEKIPLSRFLKDAFVRAYGETWYEMLDSRR